MTREEIIDCLTFKPFVFEEKPFYKDRKVVTTETRERVRAGAVLKLKDGTVHFVGDVNALFGVCDDCTFFGYSDIDEIAYLWGEGS